jgi:hypothetical protein
MTHNPKKSEPIKDCNGNGQPTQNVPPSPTVPEIPSINPDAINYEYDEEYETIDPDTGWEMLD